MGFPLSQTPVYSFLIALLELHTHGFNFKSGRYTFQSVVTLLKHPYTRQLTGQAELLEKERPGTTVSIRYPANWVKMNSLPGFSLRFRKPESVHTPVRNFAASGEAFTDKHFRYRRHRCIQPTLPGSRFSKPIPPSTGSAH